jgi:DNA-directed RNA polymerase specialized sigma24 family protein
VGAVSSETVAAHKPRVESLAWRFVGLGGAEFDDLVQEGWIKVWLLLQEEDDPAYIPSNLVIENAMKDWVRKCRRQGLGGHDDVADSET